MKGIPKFTLIGIGLIAFWVVMSLLKYYGSYWYDIYQSPWAYSRNPQESLLVGKWQGTFTDPNGIKKQLKIAIFEPITNTERWENAFTFSKKRRFTTHNYEAFDGTATVTSKLGTEYYEVVGSVEEENINKLFFDFSTAENQKKVLANFTIAETVKSSWHKHTLSLTLTFAYIKSNGNSYWSSGEPKYNRKIPCSLSRIEE